MHVASERVSRRTRTRAGSLGEQYEVPNPKAARPDLEHQSSAPSNDLIHSFMMRQASTGKAEVEECLLWNEYFSRFGGMIPFSLQSVSKKGPNALWMCLQMVAHCQNTTLVL
jgi:hypothetical protein